MKQLTAQRVPGLFSSPVMGLRIKYGLSVVLLLAPCVLLWSAYAPERWLSRIRGLARLPTDETLADFTKHLPHKARIEGRTPNEVVDELWRMATQGRLLTPEGWRVAGGFFTEPKPFPANEKIVVVSNDWGPAGVWRSDGISAFVVLGYFDAGTIDAKLRYTPPPKTDAVKTGFAYTLIAAPVYQMMYGADGRTLAEKRPTDSRVWLIQGAQDPPATTVNTAIRYVLERREKTTDRAIKKNADYTLAQLLKLR